MVSIVLMTLAIIPMMSMFDLGLHSATQGSNYDKARTFANSQLEQARSISYADLRDNFPATAPCTPNCTSSAMTVPTSAGLPSGSTYTVSKQYMTKPPTAPTPTAPNPSPVDFSTSSSDQGLIRVTVSVQWGGNTYSTLGLVTQ